MRAARTLNADAPGVEVLETQEHPAPIAGVLDDDELVLYWGRPGVMSIPLSCLMALVTIAFIAFFLAWLARTADWVGWTDSQAILLGFGLAAVRLGWQVLEWFSRIHVLTDRRIITRSGVLRVSLFQCPLRRVQHTSMFCRVRERAFGLGTIAFATAGSDTFETYWVMVRQPVDVHRRVLEAIRRYRH